MPRTHRPDTKPLVDPALLAASNQSSTEFPIDPALFAIEEVVEDVRRGKPRLSDESRPETTVTSTCNHDLQQVATQLLEASSSAQVVHIDDDGIDPALREIVNSLTNAQQPSQGLVTGLTHDQAAGAIGAHLAETEERDRLQQSLQTTLDDLAHANFGSLFQGNSVHSPTNQTFLLPQPSDDHGAGPSNLPDPMNHSGSANPPLDSKRGRGRPKGSKNKPKPEHLLRPPKPPPSPKRPKGRPPKHRPAEEQAEYDRRKEEKALGLKRKKGRPRKFPGYLVREMRLKKNRGEFNELLRRQGGAREGEPTEADKDGGIEEGSYADWAGPEGQSLLDVVGAVHLANQTTDQGEPQVVDHSTGPSGLRGEDEAMREVFGLGDPGVE